MNGSVGGPRAADVRPPGPAARGRAGLGAVGTGGLSACPVRYPGLAPLRECNYDDSPRKLLRRARTFGKSSNEVVRSAVSRVRTERAAPSPPWRWQCIPVTDWTPRPPYDGGYPYVPRFGIFAHCDVCSRFGFPRAVAWGPPRLPLWDATSRNCEASTVRSWGLVLISPRPALTGGASPSPTKPRRGTAWHPTCTRKLQCRIGATSTKL
jgi:hypothetical protein